VSRLSKNIIYNLLGQGSLLILSFVSVKYIFKQLGAEALGIITFTQMVNGMIQIALEMGISSSTTREVSACYGSEPEYIKKLIRTFSLFYWSGFVVAGVALFFLAPVFAEHWLNLKTMDTATAITVLRVLGVASIISLPGGLYSSLLVGLQRMGITNLINVSNTIVQQAGTILILIFRDNLLYVIYWYAGCYYLRVFTCFVVSSHFFDIRSFVPGYSSKVVRKNFRFASRMMSISITAFIHTQADRMIISKLLPIGTLGYYNVAYSFVSKLQFITGSVANAVFPSFSSLYKTGNRSQLMSQYWKLQDLICFGIVPIVAVIPFAFIPLFSYFLNEEIAHIVLLPATLLTIGFYMNGAATVPYLFSLAIGKPEITTRLNFYALFVVLPVTVVLVYYLGLIGAGLSWVFYNIFGYSYSVPRICRECLEIPLRRWYLHVFRVFALIGLTYGVAWVILSIIGSRSILSLSLAYVSATIVYLTVSYFAIGEEFRIKINQLFLSLKARIMEFA
jgi:O-antigen/teichoic acid export membrane protein